MLFWRKGAPLKSFPSASVPFCTPISEATAAFCCFCVLSKKQNKTKKKKKHTSPATCRTISVNTDWVPAFRRFLTTVQHKKNLQSSLTVTQNGFLEKHQLRPTPFCLHVLFHLDVLRNYPYMEQGKDLIQKCHSSAKHPLTRMRMVQAQTLQKCIEKRKDLMTQKPY